MRPTAGNAAFRPAQNSSRSSSEFGDAAGHRAAFARDLLDALEQMIDFGARAVEFDDQQRLDVERITGMDEVLGGADRRPVHHLHAARDDAGADDARDAFAAVFGRGEADQRGARRFRLLRIRTVTSVTTPSSPSEPVTMPSRS